MFLSVRQATQATGKSKPTILRAINSGKISAAKDEASGAWKIDPAELHRVFPPGSGEPERAGSVKLSDAANDVSGLRRELAILTTERERERALLEGTIADLREDRDRWRTQAEKLLLTDQRAKPPEVIAMPPPTTSTSPATATLPAAPAPAAIPPARNGDDRQQPPAHASPAVVKVRPVRKAPAKETSWLRRMMGGK